MDKHDPIRCPDCGFEVEEAAARIGELHFELAMRDQSITDLTNELAAMRGKLTRLKSDRNAAQAMHPFYNEAWEVYEHWKATMSPRSKEFKGKRFDHVAARLEADWSVEDLKLAIDGAKARPYKGRKATELAQICRDEEMLLMFLEFAGVSRRPKEQQRDLALERTYAEMHAALSRPIVARLCALRGWKPEAVQKLGLAYDARSKRIVFPTRNQAGVLVGFARWQPNKEQRGNAPKNIAEGPRELFPPPETITAESVWLVEGEPDAVAMESIGHAAVAVPGVQTWKKGWDQRFSRFKRVRICFDCDEEGRKAADARLESLHDEVDQVSIVHLDPNRSDHWDVGDLLLEHGEAAYSELTRREKRAESTVYQLKVTDQPRPNDGRTPIERVIDALDRLDCRPRRGQHEGQFEARCPNHADRNPSLSIGVGDDQRVLLTCHAKCEPSEVVAAMNLTWKELFAA